LFNAGNVLKSRHNFRLSSPLSLSSAADFIKRN